MTDAAAAPAARRYHRAMAGLRASGVVALAVAACSDPALDIALSFEHAQLERPALLTVSVIDAAAAGATMAAGAIATCADVEFARIPPDVLEGARRASVSLADAVRITGVPRLGDKLVIVEAKGVGGRRLGAGCTAVGAIEADTDIDVLVRIAPRVQELGRTIGGSRPGEVSIIATTGWDDREPVTGRAVQLELHGVTGQLGAAVVATTSDVGVAGAACPATEHQPCLDDGDLVGPLQTLVRVSWAEQPLRVAAFNPWPAMPSVTGQPIRLSPSDRFPPRWITGLESGTWRAIALHSTTGDEPDEVVRVAATADGRLETRVAPAPNVRAIALWGGQLWTVLATGWHRIGPAGLVPVATFPDDGGRASDLNVVPGCDDPTGLGNLLVRRDDRYDAYLEPGVAAPPSSRLARVVAAIDSDVVVGQACADARERLLIVQSPTGLRAVRVNGDDIVDRKFPLPLVAAVADFTVDRKRGLVGAVTTQAGPRVLSFRFASYALDVDPADLTDVLVASTTVDVPIATAPISIAVDDLDGDHLPDVLALLPAASGPRVQFVMSRQVAGQPLAAVSPPVAAGRAAAQTARLVLAEVHDPSCLELVVLTEDGLEIFRGAPPLCAKPSP